MTDREKAIQEVRQELNFVPIISDNFIEIGWPQTIEIHERAIRAERERDEAVRLLEARVRDSKWAREVDDFLAHKGESNVGRAS
jgi:hypothetical protein